MESARLGNMNVESLIPIVAVILFLAMAIKARVDAQQERKSRKSTAVFAVFSIAGIGLAATTLSSMPSSTARTASVVAMGCCGFALGLFICGTMVERFVDLTWVGGVAQ
ncbi:hypothetical protein CC78DRAFT_618487 [Lojkania enalia]|uniref:Uncharacterized protein n=1 Tax=Lojkania enalia TaxID=147567 RepID=A0A9P4K5F9_9PLEO|nr:hypothetical protein CC78DRAFT_618487 [Didymosphaeria enalia]